VARYAIDPPTLLHVVRSKRTPSPSHQLVAPNSVRSEAMELLLRLVERGELAEREALEIHERLTEMKMRLLGDRVSRRTAWRIARENGWKGLRDAEYLAVAKLQADALVTIDADLAAKDTGVVALATLDEVFSE
jgi:predicted nucleic acid-binding protein